MEKNIIIETLFQRYKNSYTGKTHLYDGAEIDVVSPVETIVEYDRKRISDILIFSRKIN